MPRCLSHTPMFHPPHGSAGSSYTCSVCGLTISMVVHHGVEGAVTVIVHPPRPWLAQLFHDIARWLEG